MNEGWLNDDYLVLLSDEEIQDATQNYGIAAVLPGFVVVGLRGWDDLIVRDTDSNTYTLPAVPIDEQHLQRFQLPDSPVLVPDIRFTNRVKWYVKPLVFGGNPNEKDNLTWVTYQEHAKLVLWWNSQYRAIRGQNA